MGLLRNVVSVFASAVVTIPLSLVASVILARWLTVEARGQYGLLVALANVVFLFGSLGTALATIYRIRRHGVAPARALGSGLWINAAGALGAIAVASLASGPIRETLLAGATPGLFALALALAVAIQLLEFLRAFARGLDRFDLQSAVGVLQTAALLAGLALVLVWLSLGLPAALGANLAVTAAFAVGLLVYFVRAVGLDFRLDLGEIRASVRYGGLGYAQLLLVSLHDRLVLFLLAWLLADARAVGIYAVAVSALAPLQLVPTAIATALFPALAGLPAAHAASITARVARVALAAMLLLVVPLALAAPVLLPTAFGEAFRPSVAPFLWLLPGIAGISLSRVVARWFAAVDRQGIVLGARAVAVALNVALNLLWVPRFGTSGAAAASLASYSVEALVVVGAFCLTTRVSPLEILRVRREDLEALLARVWRVPAPNPD